MREQWKPIIGYDGRYEASNLGRIRSSQWGRYRILRPATQNGGYKYVNLHQDRKGYARTVHRLVFEAFNGKLPKKIEVNHKDGDKANNRLSNLDQMTRSENLLHRIHVLGIVPEGAKGEAHYAARFTEQDVLDIRVHFDAGMHPKAIASIYSCTQSAIRHIGKRRSWTHI